MAPKKPLRPDELRVKTDACLAELSGICDMKVAEYFSGLDLLHYKNEEAVVDYGSLTMLEFAGNLDDLALGLARARLSEVKRVPMNHLQLLRVLSVEVRHRP